MSTADSDYMSLPRAYAPKVVQILRTHIVQSATFAEQTPKRIRLLEDTSLHIEVQSHTQSSQRPQLQDGFLIRLVSATNSQPSQTHTMLG